MSNIKISKQAIEAGVRRYKRVKEPCDGWTDAGVVKEVLTAALEHIIPKESDHAMYNVFDTAYGDRDTHAWQNRVFRGLTAVLFHLRGESKAEASTPPTVNKRLAVDDADVERVARAIHAAPRNVGNNLRWEAISQHGQDAYRSAATAAIRAMRGQVWGVWNLDNLSQHNAWYWWRKNHGEPKHFVTFDEEAAHAMVNQINADGPEKYEVRPYTAPREETADADEIASKICDGQSPGNTKYSELIPKIAQAIREAEKRGEKRGSDSNA